MKKLLLLFILAFPDFLSIMPERNNLAEGFYFFKLQSAEKLMTGKLIWEN